MGKAAGLDLSLDDRFVAQLKSPRFTAVSVAPGGHQLSMAFGGLAGKQNKPTLEGFIAAPGEVIAFRATMQMGMTKNRIVGGPDFRRPGPGPAPEADDHDRAGGLRRGLRLQPPQPFALHGLFQIHA